MRLKQRHDKMILQLQMSIEVIKEVISAKDEDLFGFNGSERDELIDLVLEIKDTLLTSKLFTEDELQFIDPCHFAEWIGSFRHEWLFLPVNKKWFNQKYKRLRTTEQLKKIYLRIHKNKTTHEAF